MLRSKEPRPSSATRGYNYKWRQRRAEFLNEHPYCVDCGESATVPDHDPLTRRELIALGVIDPDADQYLQPRCASCHARKGLLRNGLLGRGGEKLARKNIDHFLPSERKNLPM